MHNMSSSVIIEFQSPLSSPKSQAVGLNDEQHNIGMLKTAQEEVKNIWEDDQLCDITLKVDRLSIRAHKLVLASHCPYFRAMFCGAFQDANKKSVELKGEN